MDIVWCEYTVYISNRDMNIPITSSVFHFFTVGSLKGLSFTNFEMYIIANNCQPTSQTRHVNLYWLTDHASWSWASGLLTFLGFVCFEIVSLCSSRWPQDINPLSSVSWCVPLYHVLGFFNLDFLNLPSIFIAVLLPVFHGAQVCSGFLLYSPINSSITIHRFSMYLFYNPFSTLVSILFLILPHLLMCLTFPL